MPKIYILSELKFEGLINIPVLKINYLEKEDKLNDYDALIFTSKNAVYSLNSFNKSWKNIPSYAIAQKTADIIKKEGGRVEYIGKSSNGDDFAKELITVLQNKKALYIRAKKVVSSMSEILKEHNIDISQLITYETSCNTDLEVIELQENAVIIFSSPSTIKCFFKRYAWKSTYKGVVIGKTTAKYLPKNIEYIISPTTSLEKCVELAKTL